MSGAEGLQRRLPAQVGQREHPLQVSDRPRRRHERQRLVHRADGRKAQARLAIVAPVGRPGQLHKLLADRRVDDHQGLGEVEGGGHVERGAGARGHEQARRHGREVMVRQPADVDLQAGGSAAPLVLSRRPSHVHVVVGGVVRAMQGQPMGQRRSRVAGYPTRGDHLLGQRPHQVHRYGSLGQRSSVDEYALTDPGYPSVADRRLQAPLRDPARGNLGQGERGCGWLPRLRGSHAPRVTADGPEAYGPPAICGRPCADRAWPSAQEGTFTHRLQGSIGSTARGRHRFDPPGSVYGYLPRAVDCTPQNPRH